MTQPRSQHHSDRIVVVESLGRDREFRTGKILKEDVLDRLSAAPNSSSIATDLRIAQSKSDLMSILADIEADVRQSDDIPIIHFEIHGTEDGSGFCMLNGEEVLWTELAAPLSGINHATRNNLILVLATCGGAGLQQVLPRRRAPFFGMVAPTGVVHTLQLYKGMRAFYEELLSSGDGDAAVRALNEVGAEQDSSVEYHWRSAEGVFRDSYRAILKPLHNKKQRLRFAEHQLSEQMSKQEGKRAGLGRTRKAVKAAIKTAPAAVFRRARDRYLMLDEFPSERSRFTLTYEDCLPS